MTIMKWIVGIDGNIYNIQTDLVPKMLTPYYCLVECLLMFVCAWQGMAGRAWHSLCVVACIHSRDWEGGLYPVNTEQSRQNTRRSPRLVQ